MEAKSPRLLYPARPRLVDALAAIDALPRDEQAESFRCRQFDARGYVWSAEPTGRSRQVPFPAISPGEAWEAFAARGVIPRAWLDADARWFHRADGEPGEDYRRWWSATPFVAQAGLSPWTAERRPTSLPDALALASDPEGVEAAEAFARAACGASSARVIWRILPGERLRKALQYRAARWDVPPAHRTTRPPAETFTDAIVHMAAWPFRRGEGDGSPRAALPAAVFEAAEALLATGYALLAAERDVIVLACPAIEWTDPSSRAPL